MKVQPSAAAVHAVDAAHVEVCDEQDRASGYRLEQGIWRLPNHVHREDDYSERGFEVLAQMQARHFWYRGRRRFLRQAIDRVRGSLPSAPQVIDLGGGCGGFVQFLDDARVIAGGKLALGESSLAALRFAKQRLGDRTRFYEIDLMALGWSQRWHVAFMLDVLEHLPQDAEALNQAFEALHPGGLCFVTVPALDQFWSWNDEIVGHKRRYTRSGLCALAEGAGFEVLDCRYFMFLLSPLLAVSRKLRAPDLEKLSQAEKWALIERTHRVPSAPVNLALTAAFSLETPLGHQVQFPWGTSLLGVFRRPTAAAR